MSDEYEKLSQEIRAKARELLALLEEQNRLSLTRNTIPTWHGDTLVIVRWLAQKP